MPSADGQSTTATIIKKKAHNLFFQPLSNICWKLYSDIHFNKKKTSNPPDSLVKYLKHEQEDKHFIKHQISCSYNVNVINVLLTALLAATLDTYMLNYERQKIPLAGSGIKPNTKTSKQVHNKKSNLLSLLPLEKTHILRRQRSLGQLIISRSRHN